MLQRCLAALAKLDRPQDADLALIIVDNEPEPNNHAIVNESGAAHVHEPRRGIAHARNEALDAVLAGYRYQGYRAIDGG
jgi:hypothetical protein